MAFAFALDGKDEPRNCVFRTDITHRRAPPARRRIGTAGYFADFLGSDKYRVSLVRHRMRGNVKPHHPPADAAQADLLKGFLTVKIWFAELHRETDPGLKRIGILIVVIANQ